MSRLRLWVLLILLNVPGTAVAQQPSFPIGLQDNVAKADAVAALQKAVNTYAPTLPSGLPGTAASDLDADAQALLAQLKAAGIAPRMIERFLQAGGHLSVINGDPGKGNNAKYVLAEKTIYVKDLFFSGGALKTGIGQASLANIAHEFWHAYKDQVVDKGFDPDTAKAFAAVQSWLKDTQLRVANSSDPAQPSDWYVKDYDDFADEFVADALTNLWGTNNLAGGASLNDLYSALSNEVTENKTAYENTRGKTPYEVLGGFPIDLLVPFLQVSLSANSLKPKDPPARPTDPKEDPLAGLQPPSFGSPALTLPPRFCSRDEREAYKKAVFDPALEAARRNFGAAFDYDGELTKRLRVIVHAIEDNQPPAGTTPSQELADKLRQLDLQRAAVQRALDNFTPVKKRVDDEYINFISKYHPYDVPVDDCSPPPPVEIMLPVLPESLCSEAEREKFVDQTNEVLAVVVAQEARVVGYWQELHRRLTWAGYPGWTGDAKTTADINKSLPDAAEAARQSAGVVANVRALIEGAKALEVTQCIDPCLVGSWTVTKYTELSGAFAGGGMGARVTFTKDGKETVDYSNMSKVRLSEPSEFFVWTGTATAKISTKDGIAKILSVISKGALMTMHSASLPAPGALFPFPGVEPVGLGSARDDRTYICSETTLQYSGTWAAAGHPDNTKVALTRNP